MLVKDLISRKGVLNRVLVNHRLVPVIQALTMDGRITVALSRP